MHRLLELVLAFVALVVLSPLFGMIALGIMIDSRGGILFRQKRVGKNNQEFIIFKFRTMVPGAGAQGLLTTGKSDNRVTRFGRFLRTYKLDELPQLFNILSGDMSFVGPRPEVPKYVNLYNSEQRKVLEVRPGLTDYASLQYLDEGELLAGAEDPEIVYIETIMPEKLALNLKYLEDKSLLTDLTIILKTLAGIVSRR